METYYEMAMEKDHQAAIITVRLSERLSSLWGWDHAPHRDMTTINVAPEQRPTSTQQIRAALARLVAEKQPVVSATVGKPEPEPQPQPVEVEPESEPEPEP